MVSMPDVVVELALTSGYTTAAASRTWTDVTDYVEADRGLSIQRGRPDQFSTVQPSRCSLTLDNTDGRFTPEYAAGAYYPNIKKGRPLRVRAASVAASDAFGRADSALSVGTADVGGTWSALTGVWGISSGKAYSVSGPLDEALVLTSPSADVLVTADVTIGAGGESGVIARCVNITNYYLVVTTTAGVVNLYKQVAGAYTLLAGPTAAGVFTTGSSLGIQCSGTTISALVNGVVVGTATDSTFTAAGFVGIRSGANRTNWRWDNFSASTYRALFTGYVDEWPVDWPGGSESMSTVTVTASSRMARLGKSTELKSIVEEAISYDTPKLYYPLGEPTNATTAGNVAPGRTEVLTTTQYGTGGTLAFGAGTGPPTDDLTAPIFTRVDASNGKYLYAPFISQPWAAGDTVIEVGISFATTLSGTAQGICELSIPASSTTVGAYDFRIIINSDGTVGPAAGTGGGTSATAYSVASCADGETHRVTGRWVLSGGNITASVIVDDAARVTGAPVAWPLATFPNWFSLIVGGLESQGFVTPFTGTLAHVAIWSGTSALSDARVLEHHGAASDGFAGEASGARIQRYASLAGIPTAEVSTETGLSTSIAHKDTTGETPLSLMEAVAETEDGVVFDAGDGTLTRVLTGTRPRLRSPWTVMRATSRAASCRVWMTST
jgi:hypothetical protein